MSDLANACGRGPLVDTIVRFMARDRLADADAIRDCVESAVDQEGGDAAIKSLSSLLSTTGADWAYYPRSTLARRIHHALAPCVLDPDPIVSGSEHVHVVADKPVVLVANHLSYCDANVLDVVLQDLGASSWLTG